VIWLRYAIAVAAILITGRIHSKHPHEQDEFDRRPKDISANPVEAIDSTGAGASDIAGSKTDLHFT